MTFTLINARPSPYGRKVAIVLIEKGLDYTVQYDVPWGDETCTPQYSPIEQLPILITQDKRSIYDSAYILDWLEAVYPQPALLPSDVDARLQVLQRRMLGERLMEIAQALIFEMLRPEPSAAWIDRQSRKIKGGLKELERQYQQRILTSGSHIDQGDIAVATTLLGIEFGTTSGLVPGNPTLNWRDLYPALTKAVTILDNRPSFQATAPQLMDVNLSITVR